MKKSVVFAILLLASCGDTVTPEQQIAVSKAEIESANAEHARWERDKKSEWYQWLKSNAVVLCINSSQYFAWENHVSSTTARGSIRSIVPLISNGAHRSCTGGFNKELASQR